MSWRVPCLCISWLSRELLHIALAHLGSADGGEARDKGIVMVHVLSRCKNENFWNARDMCRKPRLPGPGLTVDAFRITPWNELSGRNNSYAYTVVSTCAHENVLLS